MPDKKALKFNTVFTPENRDAIGRLFTLAMAVLAALALGIDLTPPLENDYQGWAEEILLNLSSSLHGSSFMTTLLCLGMYWLGLKARGNRLKGSWAALLLAGITALVWLMGACFLCGGDLSTICSSPGQTVKAVIYYFGSAWFLYIMLRCFCFLLDSGWDTKLKFRGPKGLSAFLSRRRFWVTAAGLLLCWSVPLAVCYPAAFCTDAWMQLAQYWGSEPFTAHHPPVHILLLGVFSRLGLALGSANFGLFLFALLQAFAFALTLAYVFCLYEKLGAPKWIRLLSFLTAVFSPFIADRVGTLLKDVPYSMAFLLMTAQFIYAVLDTEAFLKSKRQLLLTALAIIGVLLMRNNGRYVLYPSIALAAAALVVKRKYLGRSKTVKLLLLMLLPVAAAAAINGAIIKHYNIAPGSVAETLSLPFQQTARYVRDYGSEVTEEEREAIDAVLPYDRLAELYNPIISDPVKEEFRDEAGGAQLKAYLQVWLKMFFKHPLTYVEATANQIYALVFPFAENRTVYVGFDDGAWFIPDVVAATGVSLPESLEMERRALTQWFYLMYSFPVIGMISHTAPYIIAAFFLSIMAAVRKKFSFLLLAVPVLLSAVVAVFAPAVIGNPRYVFPVIYSMPLLTAFFAYLCRNGRDMEEA